MSVEPARLPPVVTAPARGPARPDDAGAVAAALLDDLGRRLGTRGLAFAEPPAPVPEGWECYLYAFRLRGRGLPPRWGRPLLLRIHANGRGVARARHEHAAPRRLRELGYPVPEPLLLEERPDLFGGPFLVMERVPGPTLLRAMLRRFWRPRYYPPLMARAHARLHDLPAEGFPALGAPSVDRGLAEVRAACRDGLAGLTPGAEWLGARRPPPPARPSILHLDFHPLNLIVRPDGALVVLDWTYAEVGDPHADVAMTLLLLEHAPVGAGLPARLAALVGRPIVERGYLRTYRRLRPLDEGRLAYFRAWAALRRLARYARWLRVGPGVSGCKHDLVGRLSPGFLDGLRRSFVRWSGVEIHL
jgi:aminoglycoside phosphotransferase (APT) family kinase protein